LKEEEDADVSKRLRRAGAMLALLEGEEASLDRNMRP
jgi:hypothetical protein